MDKMMKECMKTHPMLHSLAGLGLGLAIAGLLPGVAGQTALMLGVLLLVAGVGGEVVLLKE